MRDELLLKIAQGTVKVTVNSDLLLKLAKENDIKSKVNLAKEIEISRMHLYRLLDGNNIGLDTVEKILNRFPNQEELFFLQECNKNDTEQFAS
jgi:predicted transcriptional regulator